MTVRFSISSFDKRSLMLLTALTMGTASSSWAQSTAATMKDDKALMAMFAQADKDGDKMLNPDEAKAIPALAEQFSEVDVNGDEAVSLVEFMASMAPKGK